MIDDLVKATCISRCWPRVHLSPATILLSNATNPITNITTVIVSHRMVSLPRPARATCHQQTIRSF